MDQIKLMLFMKKNHYSKGEIIMKVAVTWQMAGYVDIPADTMEEAIEKFRNESDYIPLPEGEYVDGSFSLTSDDVDEMEAMAN